MINLVLFFLYSTSYAGELAVPSSLLPVPRPIEDNVTSDHDIHSTALAREFSGICENRGISPKLCQEMVSPNTRKKEKDIFHQLFGHNTPHILIPPKSDWEKGFELASLLDRVVKKEDLCVKELRNWYRPNSPKNYNSAVGGIRESSHINSNALDIFFCTTEDMIQALKQFLVIKKLDGKPKGIITYHDGAKVIHISRDEDTISGPLADVKFKSELELEMIIRDVVKNQSRTISE